MQKYTRVQIRVIFLAVIVYIISYMTIFNYANQSMGVSAIIPVIALGWHFGLVAGIGAGILSLPINFLMFTVLGLQGVEQSFLSGARITGAIGITIVGAIVGRISNLSRQLNKHRQRLNELIREKTTELTVANEQLKAHEQELHAVNQQLRTQEQQLRAANRQLQASNQQLITSERELRVSNEFLDNIFKTNADGIMVVDDQGSIVRVNKALEQMLGYHEDEIRGRQTMELSPRDEEHVKNSTAMIAQLFEKGFVKYWEIEWLKKDGSLCPTEANITLLHDQEGKFSGSVASIRDITLRKQSEAELRKTKDYLENLIESSLDCIIVSDVDGYITRVNKSCLALLGYHEEEILGKHMAEIALRQEGIYETVTGESIEINEEFLNKTKSMVCELLEKGKITNRESYLLRKDKKVIPIEENIVLFHHNDGEVMGSVGIIRDITERKKAEKENRDAKDFLENIFKTSPYGILVIDIDGDIVRTNKAVEKILGYEEKELIGKPTSIMAPQIEKHKEISRNIRKELFKKGWVENCETFWRRKDGSLCSVEFNATRFKDSKGVIIGSVIGIRDITEKKKAEKEIREARDFLESVIESSRDGIVIVDVMGNIISANTAMEQMCGFNKQEMVGQHASTLIVEDKAIRKNILKKTAELFEKGFTSYKALYKTKAGSVIEVECISSMVKDEKGDYVAGVSIIRDISERKKMEQQLIQSEKLKSLGELAGGVAHDFNNVLAAILGRVQLLRSSITKPKREQERRKSIQELTRGLEIIEKASMDGAETVRRIQEFSRRREDDKHFTEIDINKIIQDALEFTRMRWKDGAESKGTKIVIKKEFAALPVARGSASELREVFTNFINNAIDAMPHGGEIRIKTLLQGKNIVIKLEDSGTGIAKSVREKIFDPFFTTKGPQSTGLGMSVSYGIINRHRGTIKVDSAEGQGTTLTILLPHSGMTSQKEEARPGAKQQYKAASILVIEDEDEVRELLCDILIASGHEVEAAVDGYTGLKTFKEKHFDMVFSDLGLPEMSGWQVAEGIKKMDEKTPVAMITGWQLDIAPSEMKKSGVDLIINKPFKVDQILQLVQDGMAIKTSMKGVTELS